MKEIACQFGTGGRLKGVVSLPLATRRPGVACVLVSAGLTAKPGPYRLYAEWARRLAGDGCVTLRFDLGGIGLSQVDTPGLPLAARTERDIREALAFLEQEYGLCEFIVGGLCSGAEDALRYAEGDERVRGVILIDPHAYETPWWRVRSYCTRYTLNRLIYRLLKIAGVVRLPGNGQSSSSVEGFEGTLIDYQYMDREEATRILRVLLGRGVHVHYVYTGGSIDTFHGTGQFAAMFPELDTRDVAVDFLPYIEHVQIFEEDRALLLDTLLRRFESAYASRGRTMSSAAAV